MRTVTLRHLNRRTLTPQPHQPIFAGSELSISGSPASSLCRGTSLLPSVAALAVIGAYALNNSVFDVGVMAVFGFVGYVMRRQLIPMAPLVIILLLSHEMENSLIRSMIIFRGDLWRFVDLPIAFGLLALTLVLIGLSLFGTLRRRGVFQSSE